MLTTTSISCVQTTSGGIDAAMVGGVCENTKSPNTLFYLRKGDNVSGNRKHTPQTNGLGKYVLFPCIALYMDVSIDILKGNSFYIGV
jgi:hypothetical protein